MMLLSVVGDFHKSWSSISFVVSLLWCQGHVTAYVGFPTMPGMDVLSVIWCQGHVTAYVGFPTMLGMDDVMFLLYHV